MQGAIRQFAARRTVTVGLTLVLAATGAAGTAVAADASSAVNHPAVVVVVKNHRPFGRMLFTTRNHALYYLPAGAGSCTGACLTAWPPLLMPRGKNVPKGTTCLRVVKFGRRLQVTYNRRRLYTFASDMAGQVTGNGLAGFKVAKVVRCH